MLVAYAEAILLHTCIHKICLTCTCTYTHVKSRPKVKSLVLLSQQMCIRLNNVQLLVQVCSMLEHHLHGITDIAHESCCSSGAAMKDVGFFSKDSVNVVEHLKKVQMALVHLVCMKVRHFKYVIKCMYKYTMKFMKWIKSKIALL